jgi:hypothetical protein
VECNLPQDNERGLPYHLATVSFPAGPSDSVRSVVAAKTAEECCKRFFSGMTRRIVMTLMSHIVVNLVEEVDLTGEHTSVEVLEIRTPLGL